MSFKPGRIIVTFLALLLLLSVLPAFTAAVKADGALISKAEVHFTPPAVGTTTAIGPNVTIPEGANYIVEATKWLDENQQEDFPPFTFEAGKTYQMFVTLKANDSFHFDEAAVADVNGGTIKSVDIYSYGSYSAMAIYLEFQPAATPADKAANPLTVKGKTATVKYSKVKKKAQTLAVSKVLAVTKAQGKVTYAKASGSGKITINKTTGKVTVKKGTKKGTYKAGIKVTAAGNDSYRSGSKTSTITIKVR